MTGSSHRSGWVLAGAQIAYVLVFAVCAWAVVSHGQDGPGPQGRRPLTATLIVTSLAALASIAVAVSPAGQAAWGSILD